MHIVTVIVALQGYVFWEYTPLAFRHKHLDQVLPLSLRALSHRHRGRVSENLLWYIPKALVLIIIAGAITLCKQALLDSPC